MLAERAQTRHLYAVQCFSWTRCLRAICLPPRSEPVLFALPAQQYALCRRQPLALLVPFCAASAANAATSRAKGPQCCPRPMFALILWRCSGSRRQPAAGVESNTSCAANAAIYSANRPPPFAGALVRCQRSHRANQPHDLSLGVVVMHRRPHRLLRQPPCLCAQRTCLLHFQRAEVCRSPRCHL